jgi:hypothetical protein
MSLMIYENITVYQPHLMLMTPYLISMRLKTNTNQAQMTLPSACPREIFLQKSAKTTLPIHPE